MSYDETVDPFSKRLFGPSGWTDRIVELLGGYMVSETLGGLCEFAGVPQEVAQRVYEEMKQRGPRWWNSHAVQELGLASLGVLLEAATLMGDYSSLAGKAFESHRGDERVEFTCVQVEVSRWSSDKVATTAKQLAHLGLACELERLGDETRLLAH